MSRAKRHQKMEETAGKLVWNANYATMCPPVEGKSHEQICVYLRSGVKSNQFISLDRLHLVGR